MHRSPSTGFSRSTEDYLKAIYELETPEAPAQTSAIAGALDVAPPSVTSMVKKLSESGLLEHLPYRGVQLTPAGRLAALRMVRVLQIVLGEKCRSGRLAAEVELGADVCPPGARPDGVRVCPITQNEPEGAEQNGLARSRLAGDHCQPVAQTDFERLHQCKIPYEEVSKHGLTRDELSS